MSRESVFAVLVSLLLAACGNSIPAQSETIAKPAATEPPTGAVARDPALDEPMPLDSDEHVARAIMGTTFVSLLAGLESDTAPARRRAPNGADSGVYEIQCYISGVIRFDETAKETRLIECAVSPYVGITYTRNGLVDESCQGKTGNIRCEGTGPDRPFTYHVIAVFAEAEPQELEGANQTLTVVDLADTTHINVTMTSRGFGRRVRPYTAEIIWALDGFQLIRTGNANGGAEATISGPFSLLSDDGFDCASGSVKVETLSTLTAAPVQNRDGWGFVGGSLRLSNSAAAEVNVSFLPDGSALYYGLGGAGLLTADTLRQYCQLDILFTIKIPTYPGEQKFNLRLSEN